MKVSLLEGEAAVQILVNLISDCRSFDVAVAWAGKNKVVSAMLAAHAKIRKIVIGTHMYQTDPQVLREFKEYVGARCMPPNGQLFHPKIYFFEMLKERVAVIGSHNLTGGAFGGGNIEASVLIRGEIGDKALDELSTFINSNWKTAEEISEDDFLFSYEAQYLKNKTKRRALEQFQRLKKPRSNDGVSPTTLSWTEFVERVKRDPHHSLDGRLQILERAARLFAEKTSYSSMALIERKAIAGTYGSVEPQLEGLPWPWFGTMSGQGDFKNIVNESPELLAAALADIPLEGEVTEQQYGSFRDKFEYAFQDQMHKGGVATASRLLVMKRPDVFVGVNNANRNGICNACGMAASRLNLATYWDGIVVSIQNSPWWLHERPRAKLGGRIWDNRAALLDSIYYDPSEKRKARS